MSRAPDDLATLRNGIATMIPWERHNNALLPTSAIISVASAVRTHSMRALAAERKRYLDMEQ